MISRLLVSTAALVAVSTAAFAADLPARSAPPVYVPPPAPVFTWTGFYVGANAGYAFDADRNHTLTGNTPGLVAAIQSGRAAANVQNSAHGFTGGGQIGYNYQFTSGLVGNGLVVGVEADAAYTDLRQSQQVLGNNLAVATQTQDRQDYLGTARARLGVAFGPLLIYGTGGFAYGNITDTTQAVRTGATPGLPRGNVGYTGGANGIRTGYAAGGGVEYAIPTGSLLNVFNAGAVTVKAEYLHYDLGTTSYAVNGTVAGGTLGTSFTDRVRFSGDLVRAGINYKFDAFGAPAPVVARY